MLKRIIYFLVQVTSPGGSHSSDKINKHMEQKRVFFGGPSTCCFSQFVGVVHLWAVMGLSGYPPMLRSPKKVSRLSRGFGGRGVNPKGASWTWWVCLNTGHFKEKGNWKKTQTNCINLKQVSRHSSPASDNFRYLCGEFGAVEAVFSVFSGGSPFGGLRSVVGFEETYRRLCFLEQSMTIFQNVQDIYGKWFEIPSWECSAASCCSTNPCKARPTKACWRAPIAVLDTPGDLDMCKLLADVL